jgi:DNA modification methylase
LAKQRTTKSAKNALNIKYIPLERVRRWDRNPKPHDLGALIQSFGRYGFKDPMKFEPTLNGGEGGIVEGNGRSEALEVMFEDDPKQAPDGIGVARDGSWRVPVLFGVDAKSEAEAEAYAIDHNALTVMGGNFGPGWEQKLYNLDELLPVAVDLGKLDQLPVSIDPDDLDMLIATRDDLHKIPMSEKFIVPPFSILDQRAGYWQERKKRWLETGINPSGGRPEELIGKTGPRVAYASSSVYKTPDGRTIYPDQPSLKGTSQLDPVLCELAMRWWCPPGGRVLNPAAGESVSGLVAGLLGYKFVGIDVRQEQVKFNRSQARALGLRGVRWIKGDGRDAGTLCKGDVDFVFSCPPYYDLEVYSDQEDDISNFGSYEEFMEAYGQIVASSVERLRENRFACFIVGEIRDKDGMYRNFVGDTTEAFRSAGLSYYNEAILVTPVASLHLRAGRYFSETRKLGKTHQNVLVYCKGDPKVATEECGTVVVQMPNSVVAEAADG